MPLRVVSRLQYLTAFVEEMRQQDYDATHLLKAMKGRNLNPNQYSTVRIGGRSVPIKENNKDRALEWFGEWAAPFVEAQGGGEKILVPIPSSKTVAASSDDFRTAIIARAVARLCKPPAAVAPVLRWKRAMPSASEEGGSRDPQILYPNLKVFSPMPPGICIFIDDVATSGGHLIAAAWKLADVGRTVSLALCCGCTTHEQLDDPFSVPDRILETAR
jgi:hypothetical protein